MLAILPCLIGVCHPKKGSPLAKDALNAWKSVKAFAIKAWRLPAALESASSFLVYELWVCALCPV